MRKKLRYENKEELLQDRERSIASLQYELDLYRLLEQTRVAFYRVRKVHQRRLVIKMFCIGSIKNYF